MSTLRILAASAALAVAAGAHGQSLDLSRVPPSINASLPPNLMVTLDDSGSMAFGFTPDALAFDDNGNALGNCFWRHPMYYTAQFNTQYYDPNTTYVPPKYADGTSFPNANFTSARIDGFDTGSTTYNLSNSYRVTASMAHNGPWITHSNLTTGNTTPMGPNCTNTWTAGTKTARFPSGSAQAFYYDFTPNASFSGGSPADRRNYTARIIGTGAAERRNFANWFAYYRTRLLTARTALTLAFDDMNPANRVIWQNYHANQISNTSQIRALSDTDTTYGNWKGRFYNWIHNAPASGATPMRASLARGNEFFTRGSSTQLNSRNPYYDPGYRRELSCRQNFHIMVTDGYWNGTIGADVAAIGNYDQETVTLPDGVEYSPDDAATRVYWNAASGGTAAPNLADIAFYYWANDLREDLNNDVPSHVAQRRTGLVPGASPAQEIYFNPANDPADC